MFSRKFVKLNINWIKFSILYILDIIVAVIYAINIDLKWVCATAVIIIMICANIKEIKDIFKIAVRIIKKKSGKKQEAVTVGVDSDVDEKKEEEISADSITDEKENLSESEDSDSQNMKGDEEK